MAESYLDFEPTSDGNNRAHPRGAPEGWSGSAINNTVRYVMAAVRNLGDRTMFRPASDEDDPPSQAGTLAFQDKDDVDITGGTVDVPGVVMVGGVQLFYGTVAQAEAFATKGWIICDGRTYTPPGGVPTSAPDLRGFFPMCYTTTIPPKSTAGSVLKTTDSGGSASGTTGSTALSNANLPSGQYVREIDTPGQSGAGAGFLQSGSAYGYAVISGSGSGHTHSFNSPAHTHTISDARPPLCAFVFLLRGW